MKFYRANSFFLCKSINGFAIPLMLLVLVLTTLIGSLIYKSISDSQSLFQKHKDEENLNFHLISAAETLIPLIDITESKYMELSLDCNDQVPFLQALRDGHRCSALGGFNAFTVDDIKHFDPSEKNLYQFFEGWEVLENSVVPANKNALIKIPINSIYTVEFYIDSIFPEKSLLFLHAVLVKAGADVFFRKIGLQLNQFDYKVHIESSNAKISQEVQNPENPCLSGEWMVYLFSFGNSCIELEQIGALTGLASFRDKIFGFNGSNGLVVDLTAASPNPNQVSELGSLAGVNVFPPHRRDNLKGAEDIEVLGEDFGSPQIYFIRNLGNSTYIGYSDYSLNNNFPVCNLGALGWGQSFTALSASAGSANLIPKGGTSPSVNSANFLLKSDLGEYLQVRVRSQRPGTPPFNLSLPPQSIIDNGVFNRRFVCSVNKMVQKSSPELKRSLGMTSSAKNKKRYFLL